jgi:hypothetical protein
MKLGMSTRGPSSVSDVPAHVVGCFWGVLDGGGVKCLGVVFPVVGRPPQSGKVQLYHTRPRRWTFLQIGGHLYSVASVISNSSTRGVVW